MLELQIRYPPCFLLPVQYTVLATVAMTMLVKPVPAPRSKTVAPRNMFGSEKMKSASRKAPRHTWYKKKKTHLLLLSSSKATEQHLKEEEEEVEDNLEPVLWPLKAHNNILLILCSTLKRYEKQKAHEYFYIDWHFFLTCFPTSSKGVAIVCSDKETIYLLHGVEHSFVIHDDHREILTDPYNVFKATTCFIICILLFLFHFRAALLKNYRTNQISVVTFWKVLPWPDETK